MIATHAPFPPFSCDFLLKTTTDELCKKHVAFTQFLDVVWAVSRPNVGVEQAAAAANAQVAYIGAEGSGLGRRDFLSLNHSPFSLLVSVLKF